MRGALVAFDLETTGLDVETDDIIEIGAVRIENGQITDEFSTLVNPGIDIPAETTHITGIYQEDLKNAPTLKQVLPQIDSFAGTSPVIAHNVSFDIAFMRRFKTMMSNLPLDTFELASILMPRVPRYSLSSLSEMIGVDLENAHRALDDARATGLLYWHLWELALQLPVNILREITVAAEPFQWDLLPFFNAALREKYGTETEQIKDFAPLPPGIQPLKPNDDMTPIDTEATQAILGEGGALSQHIENYENRPQQTEMSRDIAEALNTKEHLVVEAGTGTGKSIAYLVPAIQWAVQNNARVVISTNTINLQNQLISNDVPLLQAAMAQTPFKAAVMKGRGNYLCPRRLAAMRRRRPNNEDELRTMAKLLVWLQESQTGDRGEISLRSGEYYVWNRLSAQDEGCSMHRCQSIMGGTCPFYKARKEAEAAHIVIVNHALLISDALAENRVLPEFNYLVVDEAHQLEDAVTNGMSIRVDQINILRRLNELGGPTSGVLGDLLKNARDHVPDKKVMRLEAFIEGIGGAIKEMAAFVQHYFRRVYEFMENAGTGQMRVTNKTRAQNKFVSVQDAWGKLDEFFEVLAEAMEDLSQALHSLEKYEIPKFDDHVNSAAAAARYLKEVRNELHAFNQEPDNNTIYWINNSRNPDYVSVQMAPLNVGAMVEQFIWQAKDTAILTSATLQTDNHFGYMQDRLYAEEIETKAVGSPFDYRQSTLIYIPNDVPAPNRDGYQQAVEKGIIELAAALKGRVMVLFTSYAQLRETASNISTRLALGNIVVYDQATGGSRESLLDSFKSADKAVLLGTRSFWEGVDIPGTDLSALVIVRLPFAVPSDPIFSARSETYNNHFKEYAIPDAILRFRQGFGRLIRTRSDRGIVAIFDSRVIAKSYGASFIASLPDCTVQQGRLEALAPTALKWLDKDQKNEG